MPRLLECRNTDLAPVDLLRECGEIFAVFDESTQDSGNVSYGVTVDDTKLFIKTAGSLKQQAFLSHADRVHWLRNAVTLAASVEHKTLPKLKNVIESPHGPMLITDWAPGELLYSPAEERTEHSPLARFHALSMLKKTQALTSILDAHVLLCEQGWVACDFYDGAILYDFDTGKVHLVDLDMYRRGSFINEMGRMFGSTRFMAPEEFELGATIDERTTVFNLGRCIRNLLGDGGGVVEVSDASDADSVVEISDSSDRDNGVEVGDASNPGCRSNLSDRSTDSDRETESFYHRVKQVESIACRGNPQDRYPDVRSLLNDWERVLSGDTVK